MNSNINNQFNNNNNNDIYNNLEHKEEDHRYFLNLKVNLHNIPTTITRRFSVGLGNLLFQKIMHYSQETN